MANIEKMIASTFMEIAQGLETGSFDKRPKIALTGMGSEHGEENSMAAAIEAAKDGIDVYYIGTLEAEGVTTVKVANNAFPIPNRCFYCWTLCNTCNCKRNVYCKYNRYIQHRSYRRYD